MPGIELGERTHARMTDTSKLPPRERAQRYRQNAWNARLQAQKSAGEMRAAFIMIAEGWEELAREADQQAGAES